MEDRHVILHDLVAHLPENLQHKINPEDHISFYAGINFIHTKILFFEGKGGVGGEPTFLSKLDIFACLSYF